MKPIKNRIFNLGFDNSQYSPEEVNETLVLEEELKKILVWNDDFNTFDHVIEALIEICDHTEVQAEQCAYLIHTTGKHDVKKGKLEELKPRCQALLDRGISAEIY